VSSMQKKKGFNRKTRGGRPSDEVTSFSKAKQSPLQEFKMTKSGGVTLKCALSIILL
jgi:hypothetical protein